MLHVCHDVVLIRVAVCGRKLLLVSGQAPTAMHGLDEVQFWWDRLRSAIYRFNKPADLLAAMLDSNCRVGSAVSPAICPAGGEMESEAGNIFHGWLFDLAVHWKG